MAQRAPHCKLCDRRISAKASDQRTLVSFLLVCGLMLAIVFSLAPPANATPHKSSPKTLLALGDSLAFGYQQTKVKSLAPNENPAGFNTGFVDNVAKVLRVTNPKLRVINDGCPGETTQSFIVGPCVYAKTYRLHHPYKGSQLHDAVSYLKAHKGTVSPILLAIGGNDLLALPTQCPTLALTCLTSHLTTIVDNVSVILKRLRAAAPTAQIIQVGAYNPLIGALFPQLASGDLIVKVLNTDFQRVDAKYGVKFANPFPIFNPPGSQEEPAICTFTGMCQTPYDIHPTNLGYSVMADLVLQQYYSNKPRQNRLLLSLLRLINPK